MSDNDRELNASSDGAPIEQAEARSGETVEPSPREDSQLEKYHIRRGGARLEDVIRELDWEAERMVTIMRFIEEIQEEDQRCRHLPRIDALVEVVRGMYHTAIWTREYVDYRLGEIGNVVYSKEDIEDFRKKYA